MKTAILGLLVLGLLPTAAFADRHYDSHSSHGGHDYHYDHGGGWHGGHDSGWGFSLGFTYSDPWYPTYYAPTYCPPPVVYSPPPVYYYEPAPVYVAPAPRYYYYDRPAYRFESHYYYRR